MKEELECHFADFARCMGKYGIQTEDVYNFDETGFQIGVVAGRKVLVPDQKFSRLLIFDGYRYHFTTEFVDYCWHNKNRPFLLPPHLTHVLQPLDINLILALGYNFKKAVRREIFLETTEIYSRSVTHKHAISAFRKSGLVPLDSSYNFEKLRISRDNIQDSDLVVNSDVKKNEEVIPPFTPSQRQVFDYD